jgi:RNA polymerase sigma-70 factor (ECF subfamily)
VRAQAMTGRKIATTDEAGPGRNQVIARVAVSCGPRGYRIARDLLGDAAEAEDAVQEALARACTGMDRLRDAAAIDGWFYTVLTNHCMRTLRRRRWMSVWSRLWSTTALEEEPAQPGPDRQLADAQGNARLLLALDQVAPRQRAALVLRYGHDLSVDEIAALLGISSGSVKTHLVRGLERLRSALGGTR